MGRVSDNPKGLLAEVGPVLDGLEAAAVAGFGVVLQGEIEEHVPIQEAAGGVDAEHPGIAFVAGGIRSGVVLIFGICGDAGAGDGGEKVGDEGGEVWRRGVVFDFVFPDGLDERCAATSEAQKGRHADVQSEPHAADQGGHGYYGGNEGADGRRPVLCREQPEGRDQQSCHGSKEYRKDGDLEEEKHPGAMWGDGEVVDKRQEGKRQQAKTKEARERLEKEFHGGGGIS